MSAPNPPTPPASQGPRPEPSRPAILVVEDDTALRETLAYNLRQEGYPVREAPDGVAGLEAARQQPLPGLLLLDVMLPRLDGIEVCRRLRAQPETARIPILMLTARADETDKIVGLEMGADDYVTKPFSWAEVRARVRALLRRGDQSASTATPTATAAPDAPGDISSGRVLVADDVRIDEDRREVSRGERQIELPARLFDLLAFMVRHRGTVLTRDRILERVWAYEYPGDTRTVDVHIRWLREKLEDDPANPRLIQTVRGVGYRFKAPSSS